MNVQPSLKLATAAFDTTMSGQVRILARHSALSWEGLAFMQPLDTLRSEAVQLGYPLMQQTQVLRSCRASMPGVGCTWPLPNRRPSEE